VLAAHRQHDVNADSTEEVVDQPLDQQRVLDVARVGWNSSSNWR
jgi:hypothetical protein